MATAGSLQPDDNFLCSICLDVFTEPVSIPCGHNFCKTCISKHWKDKQQYQCPMCNQKFNKRLKLNVNTGFRDVVENYKKHGDAAGTRPALRHGEVPCDICQGTKMKAVKTCLVCLSSYCENHLETHQRVPALQSHQLTDPVISPSDVVCKKHNRMLEFFCKDDMTPFCCQCREHRAHFTVRLEEECDEKKAQLSGKITEAEAMIQERLKKVREIEEAAESKRKDKDDAVRSSLMAYTLLATAINEHLYKLQHMIQEKQKAVDSQAEVLVKELKEEITELQRRSSSLTHISQIKDHFLFIKSFQSVSSSPVRTKNWSEVSPSSLHRCLETVRAALAQLEDAVTKEMQGAAENFHHCFHKILSEETVRRPYQRVTDLESVPEGIKLDIIRQQYSVDVTFDPSTASDYLLFSHDLKQVRNSHLWRFPEGTANFNRYAHVLGKTGFSGGRFYFEVQVEMKTGWDLGVVSESALRMRNFTPVYRNGFWIIRLRDDTDFRAQHNIPVPLLLMGKLERVGVFGDYDRGLVSFYDAGAGSLIYSFTDCTFTERVFPFFSPGPSDDGRNDMPLILSPPPPSQRGEQNQQPLEDPFRFILLVIIFVLVLSSIKS